MASRYVLRSFQDLIGSFYAGDTRVKVEVLRNHQSPADITGTSSNDRARVLIVLREQADKLSRTRLSSEAPVDEDGTIDVDVLVSSQGTDKEEQADVYGDQLVADGAGIFWGQIDPSDLIEVDEITRGPSGARLGRAFYGITFSVSYSLAGGGLS